MRSNNDPITGLKQRLLDWKIITEDELKKIDKEVRASVEKAVEEAKKSPEPEPGDEMWKVSSHFCFHGIISVGVFTVSRLLGHLFCRNFATLDEGQRSGRDLPLPA